MTLDAGDPRAPYLLVADALIEMIRAGEVAPHEKLPSHAALAERFGVSRMTIQQAQRELKSRGLLIGRQGQGVFVARGLPRTRRTQGTRTLVGSGLTPAEATALKGSLDAGPDLYRLLGYLMAHSNAALVGAMQIEFDILDSRIAVVRWRGAPAVAQVLDLLLPVEDPATGELVSGAAGVRVSEQDSESAALELISLPGPRVILTTKPPSRIDFYWPIEQLDARDLGDTSSAESTSK